MNAQYKIKQHYTILNKDLCFTQAELTVLACLIKRCGRFKVATILDVHPYTVDFYIANLKKKFGLNSVGKVLLVCEAYQELWEGLTGYYQHLCGDAATQ